MNVPIEPGKYVVAVSGGVDSVSLLHMLQNQPGVKLVVAHFDHGIRPDSKEDRLLVQDMARQFRLPFVYSTGKLGTAASEAAARKARYAFLRRVQQASGARAIITAHHQDDLLETAILNLLRGTGRKGLTALSNRSDMVRPLLHVPKHELIRYAQDQGLVWREDSTNQDETYKRNFVRLRILPMFDDNSRNQLRDIINHLLEVNQELDGLLANQLHQQTKAKQLDRVWFNHLPHPVAREVMASWLRAHGTLSFDKKTLERLVIAAKVATAGKRIDVMNGLSMRIGTDRLALTPVER
jgi:tRNA(Ile)-lysidine synthase